MNAADVLRDAHNLADDEAELLTAALLAHGEQGVAILADGTLRALEYLGPWSADPNGPTYRLVPLSAEAGDQGTWMGGGLEITYPSAEVGDTDG
jgi:hypothetical protein